MARKFKPDISGYRELMKSGAVQGLVNSAAEKMAEMATGLCSDDEMDREPFATSHGVDSVAAWAVARTNSPHGRNAENANKVLTKAYKSVKV